MSKLLEALKRVQAGERPAPELGICANVSTLMESSGPVDNIYRVIEEMSPHWPHYSGNPSYPVEGSSDLFWPVEAKRNRWNPEDDHGALRLDLLEWLIQELSK